MPQKQAGYKLIGARSEVRSRGLSGGGAQGYICNFGGSAEAHRRAPESGAGADVDLRCRVTVAMKPLQIGLLQLNRIIERPDLSAMCMP